METVRLLRSQLRNKNILRVVDADAVPLAERALQAAPTPENGPRRPRPTTRRRRRPPGDRRRPAAARDRRAPARAVRRCSTTPSSGRRWARSTSSRSSSPGRFCSSRMPARGSSSASRSVRLVRPSPGRAGPDLHGAHRLHPPSDVRLHRRPHRRAALQRVVPRGSALQRQPADPGPVLLLRAHGPAAADLPQHPERTEDPRFEGADQGRSTAHGGPGTWSRFRPLAPSPVV